MSPGEIVLLLGIGLGAGVLAGLMGIGGGVVIVPAMVLLAGFDQHVAQGTSLVVIIPSALLGSVTHYRHRRFKLADAGLLAVGGVLGALAGSLTALSLDDELLRRLFALLILAVAARMLFSLRGRATS
ncbi:MAG: sulfite exporter TauE/SafE family protein [Chloroflexi bacterium]|nr:sulfite exporter TauE/SafE family protein [Chloroflexota bacterium]